MLPHFVIGDVHSHYDRLEALLEKAGLVSHGERTDKLGVVVQLGDLVHFGLDNRADLTTAKLANKWVTVQLWGNHDAPILLPEAVPFRGMGWAAPELKDEFRLLAPRVFYKVGPYAISHAGIHPQYQGRVTFVETPDLHAVGPRRGGSSPYGGPLWRDASEELFDGYPQIFGHTRHDKVTQYGRHWCIDVADKTNGRLAGIWLPSLEVVEI